MAASAGFLYAGAGAGGDGKVNSFNRPAIPAEFRRIPKRVRKSLIKFRQLCQNRQGLSWKLKMINGISPKNTHIDSVIAQGNARTAQSAPNFTRSGNSGTLHGAKDGKGEMPSQPVYGNSLHPPIVRPTSYPVRVPLYQTANHPVTPSQMRTPTPTPTPGPGPVLLHPSNGPQGMPTALPCPVDGPEGMPSALPYPVTAASSSMPTPRLAPAGTGHSSMPAFPE